MPEQNSQPRVTILADTYVSVKTGKGAKETKIAEDGAVTLPGTLAVTGASTLTGGAAVTSADGLTVGAKIVPQTMLLSVVIPGGAAVADFDGVIPIPVACKIVSVKARWQTASAAAETLMVKKVPSGTAKASGTDCLSAGLALDAAADTNVSGALHATAANYTLAAGDGLALVPSGAPTSLDGVAVTIELQRV